MSEQQALTEAVYYILLVLLESRHGYGIMQTAEKLSGGRVRLAAGTLYGALTNLVQKGWIKALDAENGSRKKEYIITEQGRAVLVAEWERLRQLVENGAQMLKERLQ